jgi:hypothetical protein
VLKAIPAITDREQQHLIKEAMIDYFIANKYYSEDPRTEILIMPKKPECCDQVKEVLSLVPPCEISSISEILSCIADWCDGP